jgi:hypothetical protein
MISEIDIRDWNGQKYQVVPDIKLHDVPRNSWIQIEGYEPFFFHHIDGMYSLCKAAEGFVHPVAWTVVDYWKPVDAPKSP